MNLQNVERTFSSYLRMMGANRGRDYNAPDTHNLKKKVFQRYGNSYILTLRRWGRFIIGPHWLGVLFTVCMIAGGTWLNLRLLHKHSMSQQSLFNFKVFIGLFAVLTNVFLFLTATTDPGILFEPDQESSTHTNHTTHTAHTTHINHTHEFCEICRVSSADSYHCPECDYCIASCDHHCPWMGQCIGRGNMRWFIIFNVCWVTYFSEFMYMAFSV
ncbi:DHHC palmitoyltransferase-domain-containing protein [Ochromonadaceae sp. CCMP2298]|nr:DHHC palmitoyltransferase-domain-containing protein [Ochromonadaceae sp. CCMP2298]